MKERSEISCQQTLVTGILVTLTVPGRNAHSNQRTKRQLQLGSQLCDRTPQVRYRAARLSLEPIKKLFILKMTASLTHSSRTASGFAPLLVRMSTVRICSACITDQSSGCEDFPL